LGNSEHGQGGIVKNAETATTIDYEQIGLKVGIEIHQQLDTFNKLFCGCPTVLRDNEESCMEFSRFLKVTKSEMGEEDVAAREEVARSRKYVYLFYDTTCLVEADEEPPSELNLEALKVAVEIALLLHMRPVDEVHTMRKIVVDGSNTSGFQRTALVAMDGYIETEDGRVGIDTLCLEEEAAQKVEEKRGVVVYSLDRLGIPLVEIGTAPDIRTPHQAKQVAAKLGMILRSTEKIKRGLGTIRQDVNVSIRDGARVEIKGVQELELLDTIVENEVMRQINLLAIRDELKKRGAWVDKTVYDVTDIFADTQSKVLKKGLKQGRALASVLKRFSGLVGKEIQPERRFGSELADIAKLFGLGGIFHTDELPAYGISIEEVARLRDKVNADENDCIILIVGEENRAKNALERILKRAEYALEGVPEETRKALENGSTAYLRPLPGAARMYPETDVPPVQISGEFLKSIKLPELIDDRIERFKKEYGLNDELATVMARSSRHRLFEELVRDGHSPPLVVRILEMVLPSLEKEGINVISITDKHFKMVFNLLKSGKIAKEGIDEVLKVIAERPDITESDLNEIVSGVDVTEIEKFIKKLVQSKEEFIRDRKERAFSPLMGLVMKEFRGKVDGKVISELLRKEIQTLLNDR
jgi:glutamyl-tRNA(Gln) amidotransferase subunit E